MIFMILGEIAKGVQNIIIKPLTGNSFGVLKISWAIVSEQKRLPNCYLKKNWVSKTYQFLRRLKELLGNYSGDNLVHIQVSFVIPSVTVGSSGITKLTCCIFMTTLWVSNF